MTRSALRAAPVTAFVALGSNLDGPARRVVEGFRELSSLRETRLATASSLYRSSPVGYLDQPDYVNAVARIETALSPRALLDALLAVEVRHGRVRTFPNAPRVLDLDVVLYGEQVVQEPGLTIPHPRMHERAFVVVPLAEIAPDWVVPARGRARDLLAGVDVAGVTKLETRDVQP